MHNHHQMIRALALELDTKFKGLDLTACFSRSKEEIYFEFSDGTRAYGWSMIFHNRGLFFRTGLIRFRNGKDLKQFKESIGATVLEFIPISGERVFVMKLSDGSDFIFKCFGVHSNIIEMKDGVIKEIYRTHLKGDYLFTIPEPIITDHPENYKIRKGYRIMADGSGWSIWKDAEKVNEGKSILEGLSLFAGIYLKESALEEEKQRQIKHLQSEIQREEKKRTEVMQRMKELEKDNSLEQTANTVMANMHLLHTDSSQEIPNLYENGVILITIPKGKTPQQYAADLYRKHKNKKIELRFLETKSKSLMQRIDGFQAQLLRLESGVELPKIKTVSSVKNEEPISEKFRKFIFDGWEIYAGKNANNNELLTFEFASKNDIWLHAADVSGSHVIIRNHAGTIVPDSVLKYAGSVALALSKNKHTSLGRVVYSQRKHISRVRKGNPGEVHVMKPNYMDAVPHPDIK